MNKGRNYSSPFKIKICEFNVFYFIIYTEELIMCDSLWGDEFKVPEKPKAKEIVKKIKKETLDASDEKQIKKIVKSNLKIA